MASNYVVVIGSCMIDFVSYTSRLPEKGETIHGTKFETNFGGKGANQCVAAAKLGCKTYLVARVGNDQWGDKYLNNLKNNQINTDYVLKTKDAVSGIAQIIVAENGNNQIVIVAGANNYLSVEDIENARNIIENAAVLVLQLETKPEVAIKAMQICKGISILNASPALKDYDPILLKLPTYFCVNETEASSFSNMPVKNKNEAIMACSKLGEMGCKNVILTMGADGAVFWSSNDYFHVPSPIVKCIDSTGAGDAFIGALCYYLLNHKEIPIKNKIQYACIIASDSVTKMGTQISYPTKEILSKLPIK